VSGNLERTLSRYSAEQGALIEFNISDYGLDVVANRSGWKSLARWCLMMAHPDLDQARELDITEGPMSHEMLVSGEAIMAFSGLGHSAQEQGIRFRHSSCIGADYWQGSHPTGNSPKTWAADAVLIKQLETMVGLTIERAGKVLGRHLGSIGEEHYFELSPAAGSEIEYLVAGRRVLVITDEDGIIQGAGVVDEAEMEDLLCSDRPPSREANAVSDTNQL